MNDRYWKCEYENLRRKLKTKIDVLQYKLELMQVSINKTIKLMFDFLEYKNINSSEFIEFARNNKCKISTQQK